MTSENHKLSFTLADNSMTKSGSLGLAYPEHQDMDIGQVDYMEQIQDNTVATGVNFRWESQAPGTIHAEYVITDAVQKINLDRELDIFRSY